MPIIRQWIVKMIVSTMRYHWAHRLDVSDMTSGQNGIRRLSQRESTVAASSGEKLNYVWLETVGKSRQPS